MQTSAVTTGLVWNGLGWSNTIYEADIDINTSYPWVNGSTNNTFDVGNSFTHELGHLLGLDHSDVSDATTWATIPWTGEISKRSLSTDDINGAKDIY